jgi:transcription-repair coupling factor (superfamily II helicase)
MKAPKGRLLPEGLIDGCRRATLGGVPDGLEGRVLAELAFESAGRPLVFVARDARRLRAAEQSLAFFAAGVATLAFPAWDCLPYDRVSPNADVSARRMNALHRLTEGRAGEGPLVLFTTANAIVQRVPDRETVASRAWGAAAGNLVRMETLTGWLEANGFDRTPTVREVGEYAVRGGIVDLYAPGAEAPVRLDFFGDTLETIRTFDPATQRTTSQLPRLDLVPASEATLSTDAISRFRQRYREAFGAVTESDALYEAVSEGRRFPGMEHWLPFFHERLETLFEYLPDSAIVTDHLVEEAVAERLDQVADHYAARREGAGALAAGVAPYHPVPPESLYLTTGEWQSRLAERGAIALSPFAHPAPLGTDNLPLKGRSKVASEAQQASGGGSLHGGRAPLPEFPSPAARKFRPPLEGEVKGAGPADGHAEMHRAQPEGPAASIDVGGRAGRTFAAERAAGDVNVFDALVAHIAGLRKAHKRVVLAAWSEGARDRLGQVLADHGLGQLEPVESWADAERLAQGATGLTVLPLEAGFEAADIAIIGDQDVLGDRLVRPARRRRRAAEALMEAASLSMGDLIVHVDHGIGRFAGLKTIEAAGAPHECLELNYAGGDRLFLPVENIDLLTRYGSEETQVELDRLGGVAWQHRKARLKKRIRDMADALIKTAAARMLRQAPEFRPPAGLYDEFAARFPFEETEDQEAAIEATLDDLASGRPMDRLVCGDVGFGKTEVALRAAFVAAMEGRQVAIVVPTTLLARQHTRTFAERFRGLPIVIAHASRLVGAAEMARVKKGLADGSVDIVIGTHALLGKGIAFRDLGLLIVDEEQHFGVRHKERLKELRANVHVLTLTATPIPRTLQLALTGVRDLSLIATPPVDRLAVRTFIAPFDPLSVREALLRERLRGGQAFYVVPRIADLPEVERFLREQVPEARLAVAHGQMPARELDQVMNAFYDGQYDVLLSTTIVESGLDIPTANTLIVHRADMFGLAQLYQLRGRIGRAKSRAYALFTVPAGAKLTATAERRLKVLQSLDTLGAGFQLASHDLDIRGAGNLLGEEQSGHIKEVGFELYQQMLEEAVASLRAGDEAVEEERWSPQITIGMAVMIPEAYVPDLQLRMSLYRRLAELDDAEAIDAFAAELVDRFGPLPDEVDHLLKIVFIKALCRRANVEKVEAGPKGAVVAFRGNAFANPAGLIRHIGEQGAMAKIRPDQRVVFIRDWKRPEDRLKGVAALLTRLVRLAEAGEKQAA